MNAPCMRCTSGPGVRSGGAIAPSAESAPGRASLRRMLTSTSIPAMSSRTSAPIQEMPESTTPTAGSWKRTRWNPGASAPTTDGPSTTPPKSSPSTSGWRSRRASSPKARAVRRTSARATSESRTCRSVRPCIRAGGSSARVQGRT
uniref:Uncharacterized protein n=1 Tax=Sorangium cellulosum TaxID=56 RepID=Q9L8C2_SORCE|nr:unknown [Sorangium cellulosum]